MLGKARQVSAFRFCQSATELPHDIRNDYGRFTIALSKISQDRTFGETTRNGQVRAIGIVHGEGGVYSDRSEHPLLPVSLEIVSHERNSRDDHSLGHGSLNWWPDKKVPHYKLELYFSDLTGEVGPALTRAFSYLVDSGFNYLHVHCFKSAEEQRLLFEARQRNKESYESEQARLKLIDESDHQLPDIDFDGIAFSDVLYLKSPTWSHSWDNYEPDAANLFSNQVAQWRRSLLPRR